MTKNEELTNSDSCMSKAKSDEMTFVLLARDEAAPFAIRAWCQRRISLGKNQITDAKIQEALNCADEMDIQRLRGI